MKLLGQRLMARDFDHQVAEFQVRVAVPNGFAVLGIPEGRGKVCLGDGAVRPSADLCINATHMDKSRAELDRRYLDQNRHLPDAFFRSRANLTVDFEFCGSMRFDTGALIALSMLEQRRLSRRGDLSRVLEAACRSMLDFV